MVCIEAASIGGHVMPMLPVASVARAEHQFFVYLGSVS